MNHPQACFQTKPFTRHFYLLFLLLLAACSGTQPSGHIDKILERFHDPTSDYVMVAAHRAADMGYLENSLSAIKHAIDLGVDIVELDVRSSKDGILVLMHDGTINRTTNGRGRVEDLTFTELREFRLKKKDGTLTSERIPGFEEALNMARGHIMVDIDLKIDHVRPIVETVIKTRTQTQVFYFTDDYDVLKEIRDLDDGSMCMPIAYSYEMADSALQLLSPPVLHIDHSFYSPEVTELIRNKHARVWINALGDFDEKIHRGDAREVVNTLIMHKANIIQTEEPGKLLLYLRSVGLHD